MSSAWQVEPLFREDFRQFTCRQCEEDVVICSACDRGHCYCGKECSMQARRESMRKAGRRYQQKPDGRRKHAARQADYLRRQSASGKDDASGYPDAERLVHTVGEDAEDDLGETWRRLEPAYLARTGLRCCICGTRCLSGRRMSPQRRRR